MRIGLDARTTAGDTGVAQYGNNLIAALKLIDKDDEFVIFNGTAKKIPFWTAHFGFRMDVAKAKVDLLHVLGGTAPLGYKKPYVLTVHDLAIYRHPEWFPDGQWFSTRVAFPSAIKLATRIIVPSTATKKDLIDIFKVKDAKITVIPHGAAPRAAEAKWGGGDRRYILHLGTIEPRKNIVTLVRAFRMMIDSEPKLHDLELVLAGSLGWKTDETIDEIRKTQCEGYKISMLGQVTEEEKWKLLSQASCLALPTLYEGFGLPVIEAMAVGTPVICSNISSLPEVAGEAAIMLDPTDIDAWAANLAAIIKNKKLADELRGKGLEQAKNFLWEKTAALTIGVYNGFNSARSLKWSRE